MLYALCFMLYALCFMLYALCFMLYALCFMLYALCFMLIAYCLLLIAFILARKENDVSKIILYLVKHGENPNPLNLRGQKPNEAKLSKVKFICLLYSQYRPWVSFMV
jgi:hypothetical protein